MAWLSINDTRLPSVTTYSDNTQDNGTIYDDLDSRTNWTSNWINQSESPNQWNSSVTPQDNGSGLHTYEHFPDIKQPVHMIVIYSIAYSVIFILGIIGNSFVVSVVYRNARMHSVTNYFIVNLAIADILVCLFCVPITLLSNLYTGKYTVHRTALNYYVSVC